MSRRGECDRDLLVRVARRAMLARGFEPEIPAGALAQAARLQAPAAPFGDSVRDLRELPWCSIDNDESRDLDQLTVSTGPADGGTRVLVAVADVGSVVAGGSDVDRHAAANTTTVYTPPRTFSMLPERLSTDLTSLGPGDDRLALVAELHVAEDGALRSSDVFRAVVRNHAQLAYRATGAWLEDAGPAPPALAGVPALAANLREQDRVAQRLKTLRHEHGALEIDTVEVRAHLQGDSVHGLEAETRNRAKELIEDLMIAANGAVARFLVARRFPVLRRVVRSPERWPRIVELAEHLGERLPATPDPRALHDVLLRRRAADPAGFPDLSLSVIKLLGRGEYEASFPGDAADGHFGLAVSDYTHSTAPNRRYPDLVTQRLLLAALAGAPVPFDRDALTAVAAHCTSREDDARRVERLLRKAAAACLLERRIGEEFDGIVTGASPKGTWVRVIHPPVEGRVNRGAAGLDVGDRVRVKLVHTDPERGFVDFVVERGMLLA